MKYCIQVRDMCTIIEADSPIEALHAAREESGKAQLEPYMIRANHVTEATQEDLDWYDEMERLSGN